MGFGFLELVRKTNKPSFRVSQFLLKFSLIVRHELYQLRYQSKVINMVSI